MRVDGIRREQDVGDELVAATVSHMPEERGLYKKMKVGAHLIYLARLKGLSKQQAKEAEQQAKEAAKESALAKLAALGLTEDEAKAIMGVN